MFSLNAVMIASLVDTFAGIGREFGVQWQLILIQSINFLCVVAVLYYFAFKPILKTLDQRRSKIEEGLKFADDIKVKLAETEKTTQSQIQQAQQSAKEIMEKAQKDAVSYFEQKKVEANQMAQSIIEKSKEELAAEKEQMLSELKTEVKDLVLDVTVRVLQKNMTDEDREKYISSIEKDL